MAWYTDVLNSLIAQPDVANAIAALGSAVAAIAALFLSLLSLAVSLSALKHQRTHNQLTVRPLAYVMLGDYENQLFVKLRNNGTGPMIVKSIQVLGAELPHRPLIEAMPDLPAKVCWTNFVEEFEGRSIPAGGELVLLDLSSESSSSQAAFRSFRDKVRGALGRLSIRAEYTDIYNRVLPTASRDLKFFHRMLALEESRET
jgi:hypothetical protein